MPEIQTVLAAATAGRTISYAGQGNTYVVNVGGSAGLAFAPQTITIAPGDTVVFVNKGGFHNVKADDNAFRCAHGCDGQPGGNGAPSSSNWIANVTFPVAGNIGYYCEIHGQPGKGMFGTVIVQAPRSLASATPTSGAAFTGLLVLVLAVSAAVHIRRRS